MADTKRFEGIDSEFKELMKEAINVPMAVDACGVDGRAEGLKSMMQRLEMCQKSLNEYLDMKKKVSRCERWYPSVVTRTRLQGIDMNGAAHVLSAQNNTFHFGHMQAYLQATVLPPISLADFPEVLLRVERRPAGYAGKRHQPTQDHAVPRRLLRLTGKSHLHPSRGWNDFLKDG